MLKIVVAPICSWTYADALQMYSHVRNRRPSLWRSGRILAVCFGMINSAFGEGTVYFANSTLSKVQGIGCDGVTQKIIDAVPGTIIGVFAGPDPSALKL